MLRSDWRAIWLVRSRVLFTDLAFWLVLLGYEPQKRRFDNLGYLAYAVVFFALWIFMVLLLLADWAARLLLFPSFGTPAASALLLGSLGLLGWALVELFQAARRSPFSFSEQDASLLCATPLDRRLVALAWFIEGWLVRGAPIWTAAIVLGYALLQAQSPRQLGAADLPVFLLAGLRSFSVSVPLSLAGLALAWAAGARRLRGQFDTTHLFWLAPALAVLVAGGVLIFGPAAALAWLAPVTIPLRAGLGLATWPAGMGLAVVLGLIGLAALWNAARGMSLSRAAQETQGLQAIQAAGFTGRVDLQEDLIQKQRLGASHPPARLPAHPGQAALLWKHAVQAQRRFGLGEIFLWLGICGLNLILLGASTWTTRAWAIILWLLLAIQYTRSPLRRELSRWWLLHLLPFRAEAIIAGALLLPVIGLWLAGVLTLLLGAILSWPVPAVPAALYVILAPAVGLAGAIDVLRQAHTGPLLTGSVPDITLLSLLLAALLVALGGGSAWLLLVSWQVGGFTSALFLLLENLAVLYGLWRAAGSMLRNIQ